MNSYSPNLSILIIDDNRAIHADFRKVLCPEQSTSSTLHQMESKLFGNGPAKPEPRYVLQSAYSGEEAVELTRREIAAGRYFAMAFVDMRMPPGWDGMQTMVELKKIAPDLQFVVCSAYSDYTPDQVCERLELRDGVLFIRKPFEPSDVRAIVARLSTDAVLCPLK